MPKFVTWNYDLDDHMAFHVQSCCFFQVLSTMECSINFVYQIFIFFISLSRPCDHSVITQIEFGTLWKDLTLRFGNNGQNNLHLVRTYLQLSMQHNLTHEFNSNQGYTG